jgi:hypothetical protein
MSGFDNGGCLAWSCSSIKLAEVFNDCGSVTGALWNRSVMRLLFSGAFPLNSKKREVKLRDQCEFDQSRISMWVMAESIAVR